MALSLLVVLAHKAVEGGAAAVLLEPGVVVRVELELARECRSSFRREHASDREGGNNVLIAEGQEVWGAGSKEGYDHVTGDALLVVVGAAEYSCEASCKAGIGQVPLDGRGLTRIAVVGQNGVHDSLEGGVACTEGGEFSQEGL